MERGGSSPNANAIAIRDNYHEQLSDGDAPSFSRPATEENESILQLLNASPTGNRHRDKKRQ